MEDAISNARQKIDEALFFLTLMDKVESNRVSINREREPIQEFTYLLSAYLNACYSCGEHLKREQCLVQRVQEFRNQHPDFYKSGPIGALRTTAVHYKPVIPAHDGYCPPEGKIILRFRPSDKLSDKNRVSPITLEFPRGYFYFTNDVKQNAIWDICKIHLEKLEAFVDSCEQ